MPHTSMVKVNSIVAVVVSDAVGITYKRPSLLMPFVMIKQRCLPCNAVEEQGKVLKNIKVDHATKKANLITIQQYKTNTLNSIKFS